MVSGGYVCVNPVFNILLNLKLPQLKKFELLMYSLEAHS